jgi:hypothetical protein
MSESNRGVLHKSHSAEPMMPTQFEKRSSGVAHSSSTSSSIMAEPYMSGTHPSPLRVTTSYGGPFELSTLEAPRQVTRGQLMFAGALPTQGNQTVLSSNVEHNHPPVQVDRRLLGENVKHETAKNRVQIHRINELLNPSQYGVDMNTHFFSLEHAKSHFTTQQPVHDWSLPVSDMQKRAMVKALMSAIKSTDHAQDNVGMIRPFHTSKYSDVRVELACWNILVSFH